MKKQLIALVILGIMGSPSMIAAHAISQYPSIDYNAVEADELPSEYDNRKYTSSVKKQTGDGVCWEYVANGLLESTLMKKYDITQKECFDFSVDHMDAMTTESQSGTYGFSRNQGEEGFFDMALSYWTRAKNNGPIDAKTGNPAPYYVMQTASIGNNANKDQKVYIEQIKRLIYQYGSVAASYYCSSYTSGKAYYSSYPYDCQNTLAYNCPGNQTANHSSLIVGWDDHFSRTNFNPAYKPSQDGAFLVKNSWGTTWGDQGYFWVSYDTAFCDIHSILNVEKRDFFDTIYEYDKHGALGSMNVSDYSRTNAYMNVYQTQQNQEEMLTALSTYAMGAGYRYKLYVSEDGEVEHLKEVQAKQMLKDNDESYELPYEGYVTFKLVEPLKVKGKFIVAVEVMTPNKEDYGIPIEANSEKYCNNVQTALKRGYIASNIKAFMSGQKYDVGQKKANICLKAFTKKMNQ